MSPLARSLLVLAATALLHGTCAAPKEAGHQCTTESNGYLVGQRHDLPAVYIRPGVQEASVDVPNPCGFGWFRVGLQVTGCDDVAPTLHLPNPPYDSPIIVHRNGNYFLNTAEIRMTLWCPLVE